MGGFTVSDWYHGTHTHNVSSILAKGFSDRWPDDQESDPADPPCMHGGHLGNGIYVTRDPDIAAWYGPAVLRVRLPPATRLIYVDAPPRKKSIAYLTRKFGRELTTSRSPSKAIPASKRLTDSELVELLRHHYQRCWEKWSDSPSGEFRWPEKRDKHWRAQLSLASELRRRGFHGYGNPQSEMGVLIFDPRRIDVIGLTQHSEPSAMSVNGASPHPK